MNLFHETLLDDYCQTFATNRLLFEQKSPHQHLIIFENTRFGRVMALDGIIQTTEGDEFIYHEMLTHVPLFAHGDAQDVLIIGGGDGGILREVTKHQTVRHITQVEIDEAVIQTCREYLPNHGQGAFDDPRLTLIIDDGMAFVERTQQRFDIIISDSTDPIGPGEVLFSSAFYEACRLCLKPGGLFVAQNGVPFFQADVLTTSAQRLRSIYSDATFYGVAVPTYVGGLMTLAWATDNHALRTTSLATLTSRYQASGITTRYYTSALHQAAFALPASFLSLINPPS